MVITPTLILPACCSLQHVTKRVLSPTRDDSNIYEDSVVGQGADDVGLIKLNRSFVAFLPTFYVNTVGEELMNMMEYRSFA